MGMKSRKKASWMWKLEALEAPSPPKVDRFVPRIHVSAYEKSASVVACRWMYKFKALWVNPKPETQDLKHETRNPEPKS
jgi:hypothetical protein